MEEEIKRLKVLQEKKIRAKLNPDIVADPQVSESHIEVMDKIYSAQEMKLALKIKKIREAQSNGEVLKEKTYAEENLEKVEANVIKEFAKNKVFFNQQVVTSLNNRAAENYPQQANKEKMRGRF